MDLRALEQDYLRAGFGRHLEFGDRPALLVVDFVRAYLEPESPLYAGVESVLESATRILEAARRASVLRIFTVTSYQIAGLDGGLFYRKVPALEVFLEGSPWGEIAAPLAPRADELVISKQYPSAFYGTSLAATLTSQRIDTVVIVGLSTSGCVRASALEALQHGFVPVVVAQAVGDRDPLPHTSNLFDLQAKYAEVVDEEAVIAWFAQGGRRPCTPPE